MTQFNLVRYSKPDYLEKNMLNGYLTLNIITALALRLEHGNSNLLEFIPQFHGLSHMSKEVEIIG